MHLLVLRPALLETLLITEASWRSAELNARRTGHLRGILASNCGTHGNILLIHLRTLRLGKLSHRKPTRVSWGRGIGHLAYILRQLGI